MILKVKNQAFNQIQAIKILTVTKIYYMYE